MADDRSVEVTERLNRLGHLSAGVGHHVINAFSAIVSSAEIMRLKPLNSSPSENMALAQTIVRAARDAATVARQLIDYTRPFTSVDSDHGVDEPFTVSLDDIIHDFVDERMGEYPPEIRWETDLGSVPAIRGHAAQLTAMLGHLVDNSVEAMPNRRGTVLLTTSTDSRGWVVLEIRDSGKGMEGETMVRAVEPFFSSKPGHLGIGLSVANGIWRRHRGTLSLTSQVGEGTLVRLCVEPYYD